MKLTVIGSAGSYPAPGRACSSYLVQSENTRILLDLGNGALSRLYQETKPGDIGAVILSHAHMDHCADFVGLYHYLKFASPPEKPIPLFAPGDVLDKMEYLVGPEFSDGTVFTATKVEGGDVAMVDQVIVKFYRANHPVPTIISRLSDHGSSMCYGADGDLSTELEEACDKVDLLLGESTWVDKTSTHPKGLHLDANELGALAHSAKVKRLIVTHVAYPFNRDTLMEKIARQFTGMLQLANDGASFLF